MVACYIGRVRINISTNMVQTKLNSSGVEHNTKRSASSFFILNLQVSIYIIHLKLQVSLFLRRRNK